MTIYRDQVTHEWERRWLLRRWRSGGLLREEVCDADPRLRSAARFHGRPAGRPCPVCEGDRLYWVHWVHGDNLRQRAGTARSEEEVARLAEEVGEVQVHTVEVCLSCGWNHLVRTATAVPDAPPESGSLCPADHALDRRKT